MQPRAHDGHLCRLCAPIDFWELKDTTLFFTPIFEHNLTKTIKIILLRLRSYQKALLLDAQIARILHRRSAPDVRFAHSIRVHEPASAQLCHDMSASLYTWTLPSGILEYEETPEFHCKVPGANLDASVLCNISLFTTHGTI